MPVQKEPVTLQKRGISIKQTVIGKRGESTNNFRVQDKKLTQNLKQDIPIPKSDYRNNENMSL